ncbi:hypothetical protein IC608_17290 [Devosia sp. PTR5]|uniref:Uncharacterized protein n=1 Tax=Devosia oryzisoli TaxID=2774138 RepID=A0A927FWG6_9HYPH|nr:hypothetical protein [Devosia oryzisoli]MBD8067226.1 hypothetical protein [Devosia oryzisoli]
MQHWTPKLAQERTAPTGLLDPTQLAELLVMEVRHHPHFNNVLTHIGGGDWALIERTLSRLLTLDDDAPLTPFEARVVSLLCGQRGVTSRLIVPWMAAVLRRYGADAGAIEQAWLNWHLVEMAQPVKFRVSAMRAIRRRDGDE